MKEWCEEAGEWIGQDDEKFDELLWWHTCLYRKCPFYDGSKAITLFCHLLPHKDILSTLLRFCFTVLDPLPTTRDEICKQISIPSLRSLDKISIKCFYGRSTPYKSLHPHQKSRINLIRLFYF